MVSLALLMMLAVFAALFLTSSRFDMDAATADLDAARMDLYAEGLAQYLQKCTVASLWGFDDKPLNYDGVASTSTDPLTRCPGPDAPYTYFGGRAQVSPASGAPSYWYYPNFWLTEPGPRSWPDPTLATGGLLDPDPAHQPAVYPHPAFAPPVPWTANPTAIPQGGGLSAAARASLPPFFQDPAALASPVDRAILRWRFADLDGDGRADTPWLFYRALGNNLYIRAAIHVEDTSSRINVNVADRPLRLQDTSTIDDYWWPAPSLAQGPRVTRAETLRRMTTYKGYPWLGDWNVTSTGITYSLQSRFPLLSDDSLGRFLSELNLTGAADLWAGANETDPLNWGNGTIPGRYGNLAAADVVAGKACPPDRPYAYVFPSAPATAVPPNLAGLLGDPDRGDPGRLGRVLEQQRLLPAAAGNSWDPADPTRWRTYDPDALARRLEGIRWQLGNTDQDRSYGIDDTFDVMSSRGLFVFDPATGEQRYRSGGGLPTTARLERLWPGLLVDSAIESHSLQWRRLLTGYSWTLNLCPYGEDPYWVAHGSLPGEAHTFRKVNLSTCTADEFCQALRAANRRSLLDPGAAPLSDERIARITANFLGYRNKPMNASDLARYLLARSVAFITAKPVPAPPPNTAWSDANWLTFLTSLSAYPASLYPGPRPAAEGAYLNWLFGQWNTARTVFWSEINVILSANPPVSAAQPQSFTDPATGQTTIGLARHPYIVELYTLMDDLRDVTTDGVDPFDPAKMLYNRYAVELYNPWDTAIDLKDWFIRSSQGDHDVALSGVIPPYGRFVVARWTDPTPSTNLTPPITIDLNDTSDGGLIVAGQRNTGGPTITLFYRGSVDVVYDRVTSDWTTGFDANNAGPAWVPGDPIPPPYNYDIVRRDDNGFWCYQRWAVQMPHTLRAPNVWPDLTDPWNVATYGPNPAVPRIGVGEILSPAELTLIPYDAPDDGKGAPAPLTLTEIISPFTALQDAMLGSAPQQTPAARFEALGFGLPMLFHYDYTLGVATSSTNSRLDQTSPSKRLFHSGGFAGVYQALMDFVTVDDYTADWIDSQGNSTVAQPALDRLKMRVPGRLNVNTVRDWSALDQLPFLAYLPPRGIDQPVPFGDVSFWHRLVNYREKNEAWWYWPQSINALNTRRLQAGVPALRDCPASGQEGYFAAEGIEQLGEICNLMVPARTSPTFEGLWQRPTTTTLNRPLLPPQYMRKFMGNVNLLTTRGDTFMATLRVEIVRAVSSNAGADPLVVPSGLIAFFGRPAAPQRTQVTVIGQKEYMYLIDRSFCTRAPQMPPVGLSTSDWGGAANPQFNGRVNPEFVPPRVWRMTVPRYAAYGG